jgi:hypothetical protein
MPKTPVRIDLGDEFPDTSNDDIDEFVIAGPIFGRDWRVLQNVNIYTALASSDDPTRYSRIIADAIHPDDRAEFLELLQRQRNMGAEKFLGLANKLIEAASGNPTTSSSGSSPGTPRKAVARRSVAR